MNILSLYTKSTESLLAWGLRIFRVIKKITGVVGLSLIVFGVLVCAANIFLLIFGERVKGEVVAVVCECNCSREQHVCRTLGQPLFSYEYKGQRRSYTPLFNDIETCGLKKSETILVVNVIFPDHVRMEKFLDMWFLPIVLMGFGCIWILMHRTLAVISDHLTATV